MSDLLGKGLANLYFQDRVPYLASKPVATDTIPLSAARVSQERIIKDSFSIAGPNQNVTFLAVPLIDEPPQVIIADTHEIPIPGRRAGALYTYNLQSAPRRDLSVPFDSVTVLMPQSTLDQVDIFAQLSNRRELRIPPFGTDDPVVAHLVASLVPALERPEAASQLFVDHVLNALQIHMLITYGGVSSSLNKSTGSLAAWQVKRAKELMAAYFNQKLSLQDIANACNLSTSHFSRAFKKAVGLTPHGWLTQYQIERAKGLLKSSVLTIDSVALECGFSHRVSFSRTFRRIVGLSPAQWRSAHS